IARRSSGTRSDAEAGPPDGLTDRPGRAGSGPGVWGDNHATGRGQRVTDEGARAPAAALGRGLPDVPGRDARGHQPDAVPVPPDVARLPRDFPGEHVLTPAQTLDPALRRVGATAPCRPRSPWLPVLERQEILYDGEEKSLGCAHRARRAGIVRGIRHPRD